MKTKVTFHEARPQSRRVIPEVGTVFTPSFGGLLMVVKIDLNVMSSAPNSLFALNLETGMVTRWNSEGTLDSSTIVGTIAEHVVEKRAQ